MSALEREIQTYNEKLSEMLPHIGKFVLIRGDDIEGFFDTYGDALKAAYSKHPDGQFLVKRIAPAEQVSYFTRDFAIECRP
jgi:hypothetical protein